MSIILVKSSRGSGDMMGSNGATHDPRVDPDQPGFGDQGGVALFTREGLGVGQGAACWSPPPSRKRYTRRDSDENRL